MLVKLVKTGQTGQSWSKLFNLVKWSKLTRLVLLHCPNLPMWYNWSNRPRTERLKGPALCTCNYTQGANLVFSRVFLSMSDRE